MSEKKLLSISILISNRPDTVEKCLKSLDSLRSKVLSELILIDTGCGEQVRKMIEPYADEIIEFEWCNDFAKARNVGLKRACGEWFMYMDDDEWFENTDEIEEFFLEGKHRHYNYGQYYVRNYLDPEGKRYEDALVGRLIKLYPDVEFQYAIHEAFTIARPPVIQFQTYVHHYGYAYKTPEDRLRHAMRNIQPLLEEHEKDRTELRHNVQLAQEYISIREWEKSLEISWEGINDYKPNKEKERYLNSLYCNVVKCHLYLKQFDMAISSGREFLANDKINRLSEAIIFSSLGKAYLEKRAYELCDKFICDYERIFDEWKENRDQFREYEGALWGGCFSEDAYNSVMSIAARSKLAQLDFAGTKHYFEKLCWEKNKASICDELVDFIEDLVNSWLLNQDDETNSLEIMMRQLLVQELTMKVVITCLNILLKQDADILKNATIDWSQYEDKSWIFLYLKVRSASVHSLENIEDFSKLWGQPVEALTRSLELGLWDMAYQSKIDMKEVISQIPYFKWKYAVNATMRECDWSEIEKIHAYICTMGECTCCNLLFWKCSYGLHYLQRISAKESKLEANELMDSLYQWASLEVKLCKLLYRDELFEQENDLLPQECQIALCIQEIEKAVNNKDYSKAICILKDVLDIAPEFTDVTRIISQWIKDRVANHNLEQERNTHEMNQLAESIKKQIYILINSGQIEQVKPILVQLKKMIPEDEELSQIEKRINNTK